MNPRAALALIPSRELAEVATEVDAALRRVVAAVAA
jgi:hypothetical protein